MVIEIANASCFNDMIMENVRKLKNIVIVNESYSRDGMSRKFRITSRIEGR